MECLADLVGHVRVLSAVIFYKTVLWTNKIMMTYFSKCRIVFISFDYVYGVAAATW